MKKRRTVQGYGKSQLQAAVRARLGADWASVPTSEIIAAIQARYPEMAGRPKYEAMVWFLRQETQQPIVMVTPRPRSSSPEEQGFLRSYAWRKLRLVVLKQQGRRCACCGATPSDGVTVLNVDHIKPRVRFPALALEISNLQVLCEACNHGKGNWDQSDWRRTQPAESTEAPILITREDIRCARAIQDKLVPRLVKKGRRT